MQEILLQAPFGYAYHKLLTGNGGEPEDYIFLDINPAYEEMTGLKREAILGKRVTEVLSGFKNSGFDWVDFIEPISGRIVDANPAACAYYGYTREEILSMCIQDINMLPKEEAEKCRLLTFKGKQEHFVFPHRLKSGEIRLVDVYSCHITHSREKLLFSIIFDVTDREKYKEELYREKELLRITLLSIGDGVVTTDLAGKITALNRPAEEIMGWSEEEAKGSPFAQVFKLISEDTGKKVEDPVTKVLETGKIIGLANHTVLIAKDGRKIPIADSAVPIKDEKGQTFGVVMVFRDVTQEKAWQEKILYLSYHDSLTGLYNRRFMEEQIKRLEMARELPLAVIMADVNGLKLANDVFGHEEGDKLLKKAAEKLTVKEAEEWMYRHKLLESKSCHNGIINTLLATLFAKSAETEEHTERLKNYCLTIGREMRLSAKELDELALLAVLHDIGKVGIKESVLQKPGSLTAEDWEEMKNIPKSAVALLKISRNLRL